MKKSTLFVCAAALVLAGFVSCTKESTSDNSDSITNQQPAETVNPADENPQDETLPEGMIRLNFALTSEMGETSAEEGSKTSWDGSSHTWSDGDQIRIIWGEDASSYVDAVVENGRVSALVGDADYYYAVYPTTATYTYTAAEGKISVKFERGQSGSFSDANIMAAKTSKAAASFAFKNMTGIIKFSLAAESPYKTINFSANDKAVLNGWVDTTFPDTFAVTTRAGANTGKDAYGNSQYNNMLTVTGLRAGETYYVAVLPGVELENGIGFNVYKSGSQSTGALSTGSLTIDRGAVKTLLIIDNQIHESWFITENGTGKGTSWEDAGGPERLVQLIYPTQTRGAGAGLTAAWRLHKSTIYVAAGTYNIQDANDGAVLDPHYNTGTLNFTIKGGYPTGLSGTATTGQDPKNNATNFICNQAVTADRVFQLSSSNKIPNIAFDGITFPSNGNSLAPGTAFDFNSSAASNITFNNCYFTGFVQSGTVNGGPIYVRGTGAANITFSGCTFSGNNCNVGAAIYAYGSNSTVSFTNSTFTGNVASNGGSIRARAGIVNVTDCTFTGLGIDNGDAKTANQGGAIYIDGGSVSISGGTISDCKANSNSGAIYFSAGLLSMDGCTVRDCLATNQGGGVAMMAASQSATFKNCLFANCKANSTTLGGGALYNQGTMTVENCVFESCSAKSGAAIYTVAGTSSDVNKTIVLNSCFKSNAASGGSSSGSAPNGGCIYGNNYNSLLFANCTFSDNTVVAGGVLSIGRGSDSKDYNKLYIVSCTVAGSSPAVTRTSNVVRIFNSLLPGPGNTEHANVQKAYSILNDKRYSVVNTLEESHFSFGLGSFNNGVYLLDNTYSSLYTKGMSVSDIQDLEFENITLSDNQLALLAKDQKGNDRNGTIMGAYVLTE